MAVLKVLEPGPRKPKRFRVEYRTPTGGHRARTFHSRREAELFLHRVEAEKRDGTFRDPREARVPLEVRARTWLEARAGLRPSTRAQYRWAVERYIVPGLGSRPIGAVRPEEVRVFLGRLLAEGPGRRTVLVVRQVLNGIFEEAVNDGLIARNPVRSAPAPRVERREPPVLTVADVERLVEATEERWRPLVLLLAYGGLRIGEALGLQRRDLDLEGSRVHVRRQAVEVGGHVELAEVKTPSARRVVALPPSVTKALARHLEGRPRDPAALVFADTRGGPVRRTNWRRRVWEPAVRAAGLEGIRPHDLRHFSASIAVAAGAHPRALQTRLGHSTSRITMDVYASVLPGLDEELAERLEEVRRRTLGEASP